ncbi:MAG: alpha/beta hydrolase [Candidatus Paceibacterota bacterium]
MKGKVLIGELGIHYEIKGEGPLLLILHGWGSSTESWQKVQQELSSEFKVVILDLPGFGKSETPDQPWTIQNYLSFLERFIQELELEDFYLIGHSFGGSLSVKLATIHPELVRKMALIDSAGIRAKPKLIARIVKNLAEKSECIFMGPLIKLKRGIKKILYKLLRNTDYGKANETMKETMKNVFDYYVPETFLKESYPKNPDNRGNFLKDLEKVDVDTLLVWGEEDKITPLRFGKIFNNKIKNSKLEVISGVGHSPHLNATSPMVQIILNFFE